MNFLGENLLPGQIGHFFILLAFVASLISTISFFKASSNNPSPDNRTWLLYARGAYLTQIVSLAIVFGIVYYICANHLFEYMYAYKHASLELEPKYLLACIWEGQEGSFLLWTICHAIFGGTILAARKTSMVNGYEPALMTVLSLAQAFL